MHIYKAIALPFCPKLGHFHVEILCNKIDRMLNMGQFYAYLQGYSLTFLPKIGHFHVEILCNKIDRMLNMGQF